MRHPLTVAVIDKDRRPSDMTLLAYFHETVHRHVHRIREQAEHSIYKYANTPRRVEVKL